MILFICEIMTIVSPFTTRNPLDISINAKGNGLGGSHEIVYTLQDFAVCTNKANNIKNWIDWQNCIEYGILVIQNFPHFLRNPKYYPGVIKDVIKLNK